MDLWQMSNGEMRLVMACSITYNSFLQTNRPNK